MAAKNTASSKGGSTKKKSSSAAKKPAAKKTASTKTASKKPAAKKPAARRKTSKKTDREVELIDSSQRADMKKREDFKLGQEITVLLLFAFSVILMMGFFGLTGKFGEILSIFLFGSFGVSAYLFPFAFFFIACFVIINEYSRRAIIRAVAIFVLLMNVSVLMQYWYNVDFESRSAGLSKDVYWHYSIQFKKGGGFIGGHLHKLILGAVGPIGTLIVIATVAVICIVILTRRSLVRFVTEGSRAAAESVRDTAYDAYEEIEERRYRRQHPEGRVIPGRKQINSNYMENTRILPDEDGSDDMHELSAGKEDEDIALVGRKLEERAVVQPAPIPLNAGPIHEIKPVEFVPEASEEIAEEDNTDIYPEKTEPEPVRTEPEKPAPAPERKKRSVASATLPEDFSAGEPNVGDYRIPPTSMLEKGEGSSKKNSENEMEVAKKLKATLESFGVNVTLQDISVGPTVTRYELLPEAGVKVSKIVSLTDDIKLALAAESIRIEAPIPGKSAIGIEVPNKNVKPVMLRSLLESEEFRNSSSKISFAVGKDIGGRAVVFDIAKMPHVLIAGATGAGKSVCINTIIMSILFKARPDEVRLIMIDPKVVELSVYNGIPHLLTPVVTDPQKAAGALMWGVGEMEKRYRLFAEYAVRDLAGYNAKAVKEGKDPIPKLVIIVDELADLMMSAKSDVENSIVRLAQKARAAGIHLIIATQRPSVDVITGLIKANMPSRIAFTVTSGTDSRTILDMVGAEKLLGRGDMLFHPVGYPKPARVQGAFVSDGDVEKVAEYVRNQKKDDENSSDINDEIEQNVANASTATTKTASGAVSDDAGDELFAQVADFVVHLDKPAVSIGLIQRKFRLGFNRAARIMDELHDAGIVGDEAGTKGRTVLMSPEQFETYKEENL
ncbi:MAG: DNA translocase FtsK 4TM domain-containing protein [Lachnospiraceae bacterium]|nr:DNA translocase FtsK 4TM domain-containing protein [Lachnospiraceae bacterium]